jgi:hypothetical protein
MNRYLVSPKEDADVTLRQALDALQALGTVENFIPALRYFVVLAPDENADAIGNLPFVGQVILNQ